MIPFQTSGVLSQAKLPGIIALQTVQASFSTTDTTKTLTFSSLTDAAQCFPLFSAETSDDLSYPYESGPLDGFAIDVYDDAGTVKATVTRSVADDVPFTVDVTLLEMAEGVVVSKYTYTTQTIPTPDFYLDKTITAVNTGASFCVVTHTTRNPEAVSELWGMSRNVCGQLTSSTNLRLWGLYSDRAMDTIIAYVISDPLSTYFNTQNTFTSINGSTPVNSVSLNCGTHTIDKTLIVANFHAHGGSGSYPNVAFVGKHQWTGYFSDATTFYAARSNGNATGRIARLNVQLVKFKAGIKVQRGSLSWPESDAQENVTITAVDSVSSAVALGQYPAMTCNTQIATDQAGCPLHMTCTRITLTSTTNVQFNRGKAVATSNGSIGYQVLSLE